MQRRSFLKTLTKAIAIATVVPVAIVQTENYYKRHVEKCVQEHLRKYPLTPNEAFASRGERFEECGDYKPTMSGKIIKLYPENGISIMTKALGEIYK